MHRTNTISEILRFLAYFVLIFSFINLTFIQAFRVNHGGIRTSANNIRAPTGGNIASMIGHVQTAMQRGKDTFETGMDKYRSGMEALMNAGKLPFRHNARAGGKNVVYNG